MQLPAVTQFVDGTGPVFAGAVFPFCFITIGCGAFSGFHSLISSGTTPKMLTKERHALSVGAGRMLAEGVVAILALISASVLQPGVYFAVNSPAALTGPDAASAAATITFLGLRRDAGGHADAGRRGRRDRRCSTGLAALRRWR